MRCTSWIASVNIHHSSSVHRKYYSDDCSSWLNTSHTYTHPHAHIGRILLNCYVVLIFVHFIQLGRKFVNKKRMMINSFVLLTNLWWTIFHGPNINRMSTAFQNASTASLTLRIFVSRTLRSGLSWYGHFCVVFYWTMVCLPGDDTKISFLIRLRIDVLLDRSDRKA